jgi:dihydropyrimidinase
MHHAIDYTPYEGITVTGWPTMTLSRGEVVMRDGVVAAAPGIRLRYPQNATL